ncbi:hypothetical protein ACIS_00857 [Anaplasma centrale str. Israel]|uniref:Uncharacterized protein n=1 Tax=Anaplasma centrale (strain Israel) TaxID=574556 RepID=D1ASD2_ANACI|nr:hypothetical protein ACIS_00857 [Anaplasma centrale str. Israel]
MCISNDTYIPPSPHGVLKPATPNTTVRQLEHASLHSAASMAFMARYCVATWVMDRYNPAKVFYICGIECRKGILNILPVTTAIDSDW